MKYTLGPLLAATLTACSATMVNRPGSSGSAYGPTNEANRPGVIKYLNQGASGVVNARREDAYKQMHSSCGGRYKIVGEGPQAGGTTISNMGNGTLYASTSEWWYITFQCD